MEKQADLTREQILAMEPGAELDALVAERVFGEEVVWNPDRTDAQIAMGARCDDDGVPFDFDFEQMPPYSTDISAAWKVVEKIEGIEDANWVCGDNMSPDGKRDGYAFRIYFPSGVTDEIGNMEFDEVDGVGGSVPEAICKVALIATL